jgi:uncharacterized protein YjbI with pentapeptide repeats
MLLGTPIALLALPDIAAHLVGSAQPDSGATTPWWIVVLTGAAIGAVVTGIVNLKIAHKSREQATKEIQAAADRSTREIRAAADRLDDELNAQRLRLEKELEQDRRKLLSDRFAAISAQLGHDQRSARLAAVYGLAGLADDWDRPEEAGQRQTCIDILCAYLRVPIAAYPGDNAPAKQKSRWRADHEVRHAVIGVIRAHLLRGAHKSWQSCEFDFTRAYFDGGSFKDVEFSGEVRFHGATFCAGDGVEVTFEGAAFRSGCRVEFWGATFAGSRPIVFRDVEFSGGSVVMFQDAVFEADRVVFDGARFTGGQVSFRGAKFRRGAVTFNPNGDDPVELAQGQVDFGGAEFSGGEITFRGAQFNGATVLLNGRYDGATVGFWDTQFSGGLISFSGATFDRGRVSFGGSAFISANVELETAHYKGCEVDLREVKDWNRPPRLPQGDRPGLRLPPPPARRAA